MIVHFHKKEPYTVQAPLTSLIDIVFMLLIYFLLTTNFMVDEAIKIDLPEARSSAPLLKKELVVYLDARAKIWIGDMQIRKNELFTEIKKRLPQTVDQKVVIKADQGLMLNEAVHVMDVVKAAGAKTLCLATEKTDL